MIIHIVTRRHRRNVWYREEIVSAYADKKEAKEFCRDKNSKHDAVQPYLYSVTSKKVK